MKKFLLVFTFSIYPFLLACTPMMNEIGGMTDIPQMTLDDQSVNKSARPATQHMLSKRSGKQEIFVTGQMMSGDIATFSTLGGPTVEIGDTSVFEIGVGHNWNEHVNVSSNFFFGTTTSTIRMGYLSIPPLDTDITGVNLNMEINLLNTSFTPFISGGIGLINFTGPPELTFDETDVSYNLGAGFRWDVNDGFFIKGIYKSTWTKLEGSDESIMLGGANLSLGAVF